MRSKMTSKQPLWNEMFRSSSLVIMEGKVTLRYGTLYLKQEKVEFIQALKKAVEFLTVERVQ